MPEYGLIGQKQYDEVMALYKREGYGGGLAPGDVVVGARIDDSLVGAVRLATEYEFLVLRGMYVQKEFQRQGIGRGLLGATAIEIGQRECWCIPYAHLRSFYMLAGFVERPSEAAPRFLMERLKEYARSGRQVIIMRRTEINP